MSDELAAKTKECPKCQGTASLIVPLKVVDRRMAVYGCSACGYTFKENGGAYVEDAAQLRDIFRGATMGNQALVDALVGEKLNAATRTLLQAKMVEYGLQMWFDGLKQGLLLGAIQSEKAKPDDAVLRRIQSMCGAPNAADGCRNILSYINELKGDTGGEVQPGQ